jgi:hypothetical protein
MILHGRSIVLVRRLSFFIIVARGVTRTLSLSFRPTVERQHRPEEPSPRCLTEDRSPGILSCQQGSSKATIKQPQHLSSSPLARPTEIPPSTHHTIGTNEKTTYDIIVDCEQIVPPGFFCGRMEVCRCRVKYYSSAKCTVFVLCCFLFVRHDKAPTSPTSGRFTSCCAHGRRGA